MARVARAMLCYADPSPNSSTDCTEHPKVGKFADPAAGQTDTVATTEAQSGPLGPGRRSHGGHGWRGCIPSPCPASAARTRTSSSCPLRASQFALLRAVGFGMDWGQKTQNKIMNLWRRHW